MLIAGKSDSFDKLSAPRGMAGVYTSGEWSQYLYSYKVPVAGVGETAGRRGSAGKLG